MTVVKLPVLFAAAWAVLSSSPASAADAAPGSLTASLAYRETAQSFSSTGVRITDQATPFKKEPTLGKGAVRRGRLSFPGSSESAIPFIWDYSRGNLYLDLNRNEDLTDDAAGVFHAAGFSSGYYRQATFTNVHLTFQTKAGAVPWLADLNFSEYSGRLNLNAAQRSLWAAKVELGGQDWQVGFIGTPGDKFDAAASSYLLLRPWSRKDQPFHVFDGSLDAFLFPEKLFFNQRLYTVERTWLSDSNSPMCQLKLAERPAVLGAMKLTGQHIQRVVLSDGPCAAVLDSPEAIVTLPVGRYQNYQVEVGKGSATAHLDLPYGTRNTPVVISSNTAALLTVGGPLTNTVAFSRRGQYLILAYSLVGAGGQTYQLETRDYQNPPRFAVYHGQRQVASGKFEFG
jgi:hypothetical protein